MLLRVVYNDGNYDFVNGAELKTLIESREITLFRRPDGWVHIDSPKVRRTNRRYMGPEKRTPLAAGPPKSKYTDTVL